MSITTRQTNLLVNQDWKVVYQSFKEADFQSYDFETLRKTMIDYLRTYYPEDFNDFTDSSEYIALIDLIAFLGQSLAFRDDMNSRENFFDTAERRDSILKLAKLINYNAKRNIPASGLLKIDSVSTTESVTDSNGLNLANLIINWNDTTNLDWQEQFTTIMNSAMVNNQVVGNPGNTQNISGIRTDEYSLSLVPGVIPTYSFKSTVEGNSMQFEAISATSAGQSYLYEDEPVPSGRFNVLYRNDGLGNSSNNTGYFVQFKQGKLNFLDFTLNQSMPNRVVSVNTNNVNNTDVWLYHLDSNGAPTTKWKSVPAVSGLNVIYNKQDERNLYQVNSRANDQIDLVFGDGSFSNIPQGSFRLFYRTSAGTRFKISPDEMQGIVIPIAYVTKNNRVETLTIRASLNYTVTNAESRESVDEIRVKAPQQFYTQNRMITGEDYNTFPYVNFGNILKVKAVNRSSSGISRYLDVLDATGKYSSTNIFCSDGWLYREPVLESSTFTFTNVSEVNDVLYNTINPVLTSTEVKHFYYSNFPRYNEPNIEWYPATMPTTAVSDSGYFVQIGGSTQQSVGRLASNNLKYIVVGASLKFTAPAGMYFNAQNVLTVGTPKYNTDRTWIWASVINVLPGGRIQLNEKIPYEAVLDSIVPVFKSSLPNRLFVDQLSELILSYKSFGIRYDMNSLEWKIILPEDLSSGDFSLVNSGDTSGNGLDSSWIMRFSFNGAVYEFASRQLRYVFESLEETRFFFGGQQKVYDSKTGTTIFDTIKVLRMNSGPDNGAAINRDFVWKIHSSVMEADGYENTTKVYVTFPDADTDGVPDDIDVFETIVAPDVNPRKKFVFFHEVMTPDAYTVTEPVDNETIVTDYDTEAEIHANWNQFLNGQLFYAVTEDKFFQLSISENFVRSLTQLTDYSSKIGRQKLYFQYRHNSGSESRIDPSPNNIMDFYILTKQYSDDYQQWLRDTSAQLSEPRPPSSEELKLQYGSGVNSLDRYKAQSDTIVYNTGKYKPVFGRKAVPELRATFKVVKNPNITVSDNDIKTSVIGAINQFFETDNWDFGETFYFSELSTFLHNTLAPNIASVIIVPASSAVAFGNLMQINARPDEIIISAATVDNVEIITAVTAAQLREQTLG